MQPFVKLAVLIGAATAAFLVLKPKKEEIAANEQKTTQETGKRVSPKNDIELALEAATRESTGPAGEPADGILPTEKADG